MFHLLFGIAWTAFSSLFMFLIFLADETETNSGFMNELLFPKILISVFILIGISLIISGIKQILRNKKTNAIGKISFGKILSIFPNGTYVNNKPYFDANILVVHDDRTVCMYKETIGRNKHNYKIGDYLKVKYYNGDINIIEKVSDISIPLTTREDIELELKNNKIYEEYNEMETIIENDYVIIDGIKYVKEDKDDNW